MKIARAGPRQEAQVNHRNRERGRAHAMPSSGVTPLPPLTGAAPATFCRPMDGENLARGTAELKQQGTGQTGAVVTTLGGGPERQQCKKTPLDGQSCEKYTPRSRSRREQRDPRCAKHGLWCASWLGPAFRENPNPGVGFTVFQTRTDSLHQSYQVRIFAIPIVQIRKQGQTAQELVQSLTTGGWELGSAVLL